MKKIFTLIAAVMMALAAQAATLTVCEGTDYSSYIPVDGLYVDSEGTLDQMIYPADMLADMLGTKITSIKFHADGVINFSGCTLQLSLMIVDETEFGDGNAVAYTGATAVATVVPEKGATELEFVLDEPYEYTGGNLLIETLVTEVGDYASTYFLGVKTSNYPSFHHYYWWWEVNERIAFLPMVTFDYDEAGEEPVDPEDPYAVGYWLMMIDANGNAIPYQLLPGDNGDYTTTVALNYNVFGTVDPQTQERPLVPFYFIVNGVRVGAEQGLVEANLGQALENPLFGAEGCYGVPVGYNYNIGIAFGPEGDMYAYVAQAGYTSADELSAKSVAGVRYYNLAGQEMQQANGLTIMVTTFTDGTTSAVKVMK